MSEKVMTKTEAIALCRRMRSEGKTYDELLEALQAGGYCSRRGEPYKNKTSVMAFCRANSIGKRKRYKASKRKRATSRIRRKHTTSSLKVGKDWFFMAQDVISSNLDERTRRKLLSILIPSGFAD